MLENVRNLAGPRQKGAWSAVIDGLREVGYKVSSQPCVFSPHLLRPANGGAAQVRERVYILGVYVGHGRAKTELSQSPVVKNKPEDGWNPDDWSIAKHVLLPAAVVTKDNVEKYEQYAFN